MKKATPKMPHKSLQMLGVGVSSTSETQALRFVRQNLEKKRRFWVATPNPEFVVAAQKDKEFKKILNQADLAISDGVGLLLASKILGTKPQLRQRVTGVDLVAKVLELAAKKGWKVGIVGARRGKIGEIRELLSRLKQKYPGLKVEALELVKNWPKRGYQLILVAYGMGAQEKWICQNLKKAPGVGFFGIGGALDFLTGFSKRAPCGWQKLGLEWLWRLVLEPWRVKRQLALVKFCYLVGKEKFLSTFSRL